MQRSELLNGGAYCRSAFVAINKTATAAGSGDNTEVDGAWIDRILDADQDVGLAMSAKLVITYTTALAAGETLKFAVQFRDASDAGSTGVDDYEDAVAATVVATGDSGGSTETGTVEIDVDLSHAKQFIQAQITPDLSRNGTDTAEWSACLILFGAGRQPMTQAIASVGSPA